MESMWERVKRARDLQARFARDWKSARDHRADIVFGPEMLGTMEMEARSGKYNSLLRKLYMEGLDNILENAKGNPAGYLRDPISRVPFG